MKLNLRKFKEYWNDMYTFAVNGRRPDLGFPGGPQIGSNAWELLLALLTGAIRLGEKGKPDLYLETNSIYFEGKSLNFWKIDPNGPRPNRNVEIQYHKKCCREKLALDLEAYFIFALYEDGYDRVDITMVKPNPQLAEHIYTKGDEKIRKKIEDPEISKDRCRVTFAYKKYFESHHEVLIKIRNGEISWINPKYFKETLDDQ